MLVLEQQQLCAPAGLEAASNVLQQHAAGLSSIRSNSVNLVYWSLYDFTSQ